MGNAVTKLAARVFVPRHKRVTHEGDIVDVEAYWRDMTPGQRAAFKEQMHAPAKASSDTEFDQPDARPLKDLAPGERAVLEAVQSRTATEKLQALVAKERDKDRKPGYLKGRMASPGGRLGSGFYGTDEQADRLFGTPEATLDERLKDYLEEIGYIGPVPRSERGKEYALESGQPDLAVEMESQMGWVALESGRMASAEPKAPRRRTAAEVAEARRSGKPAVVGVAGPGVTATKLKSVIAKQKEAAAHRPGVPAAPVKTESGLGHNRRGWDAEGHELTNGREGVWRHVEPKPMASPAERRDPTPAEAVEAFKVAESIGRLLSGAIDEKGSFFEAVESLDGVDGIDVHQASDFGADLMKDGVMYGVGNGEYTAQGIPRLEPEWAISPKFGGDPFSDKGRMGTPAEGSFPETGVARVTPTGSTAPLQKGPDRRVSDRYTQAVTELVDNGILDPEVLSEFDWATNDREIIEGLIGQGFIDEEVLVDAGFEDLAFPKPQRYKRGDRVVVAHDQGNESGTVQGQTRPVRKGEPTSVTVRFDDGTISSWPESKVRRQSGSFSPEELTQGLQAIRERAQSGKQFGGERPAAEPPTGGRVPRAWESGGRLAPERGVPVPSIDKAKTIAAVISRARSAGNKLSASEVTRFAERTGIPRAELLDRLLDAGIEIT